ncbi:superoxide dismutase family protein [bacterium]|nr:superoxide dismutase family protein [bacterium]
MPEAGVTMAIARLEPARNSNVQGTVLFYDQGGGLIRIEADVYKLTPGKHGFHIHKQNGKDAML